MKRRRHGTVSEQLVVLSGERAVADLHPYASVNTLHWAPGRSMDTHQHSFVQIIHVITGCLEVDWGSGWRSIEPGHAHLLPPHQPHRLRSPRGHSQLGINFRNDGGDPRGLRARLAALPAAVIRVSDGGAVEAIASDVVSSRSDARIALGIHLDTYGLALVRALEPPPGDDAMDAVEAYLRAHDDVPIRVAEVCAKVGLSRSRVQELCTQRHGTGLAHVHEGLRLQRAARLLAQDPQRSVGEVANACGYNDLYGFSRAFRRVHGCSPSALRRRAALG